MDKYSSIFKWDKPITGLDSVIKLLRNFDLQTDLKQKRSSTDMYQDLFMFEDLPKEIMHPILDFVDPIDIDITEHSGGIETVKANQKVHLHADYGFGFVWKFTRKCNIMFNLENRPIHIIHDIPKYNKDIMPGEMMVLNVCKQHGADHTLVDKDCNLLTLNLRMDYFQTVEYFEKLLSK